jgi:hypothetical protein
MKNLIFLCCLAVVLTAGAQQPPIAAQDQMEHLADVGGIETQKSSDYLQQLDDYRHRPLSVNAANAEELAQLHLLTDLQIGQLLSYRKLAGLLVDIYELQAVPGWDVETIEKTMPYLTVAVPVSITERLASRFRGNQTLLLRTGRVFQRSKGYALDSGNRYLGNRDHLLLSYKYQFKNLLYFGMTADKDPGEQFFRDAQSKGFDFYSAHFFLRNLGLIKALALGDYTINIGQGLANWQSDGFGKSGAVLSIVKRAPVLAPYRAAGETGFNRGIGITLARRRMEASFFGSYKKVSGSVDPVDGSFGSLQTSGYYRTPKEIANRYGIGQWSWGGQLSYVADLVQVSASYTGGWLSLPWQKQDEPYNNFAFSGRKLLNASFAYSYTQKNRHWFGELATDRQGNSAILSGLLVSVDPKVDLSFLYRRMGTAYEGIEGSAVTESSIPSNERGFYTGLDFRPTSGWQLSAYVDLYRFPWLRYRVNAPSGGRDYLVQLNYQPEKRWSLNLRYRSKYQSINDSGEEMLAFPVGRVSQNIRIHLANRLGPYLSMKTRLEIVWLKNGDKKEEGFLLYAEASCRPVSWFSADLRLQYVETGSYDTRIYAYESDVLYSFSIPAFFGKTYRYYLNINVDAGRRLSLAARLAESVYPGAESIGSGLDVLAGNRRTDIKLQAVYHF